MVSFLLVRRNFVRLAEVSIVHFCALWRRMAGTGGEIRDGNVSGVMIFSQWLLSACMRA
jgi:hypothetical protein